MNRLQISLTQTQYEFLKSEAFMIEKSMAAVLRDLLDAVIQDRQQDILENDPIWGVIGIGKTITGPTDVSSNVDKYLYGSPENIEVVEEAQVIEVPLTALPTVAEATHEYTPD